MGKPWYNYFVVSDDKGHAGEPLSGVPAVHDQPPPVPPATSSQAASFDEIYAAAQIPTPGHGFTILKVAAMLRNEHLEGLGTDVKRKSVMVALDAANVPVAEIVEDAVRRDRALDTYERVLQQHVDALRAAKERENQQLEEQIAAAVAELRGRLEQNRQSVEREVADLEGWRSRKQAEEQRIADAVAYFVAKNPVTLGVPAKEKEET